jgi:hypothetical protein
MRTRGSHLFLAACLGVATPLALGQYVSSAYDSFDYAAGTTIGSTTPLGGGTGFTSDWGSVLTSAGVAATINSGGLSYPGLTSSGNHITVGNGTAALNVGRGFSTAVVDSGSFYFSYLVQKTVDTLRSTNFAFFSGTNERVAIGQIANNQTISGGPGSPNSGDFVVLVSNAQGGVGTAGVYTAANPISFAVNQTFLVVGKIDFNVEDSARDRLTVYINPSSLTSELGLVPYLVVDNTDFGGLNNFRMFAGGNQTATIGGVSQTFPGVITNFDEVRFGTSYSSVISVIPEPSTYAALFGGLALGLVLLRRRLKA